MYNTFLYAILILGRGDRHAEILTHFVKLLGDMVDVLRGVGAKDEIIDVDQPNVVLTTVAF